MRGFTLIETLIVVAIITVVSAYAIMWSSVGRRQTILGLETQKIAESILRAKSLAIATFNSPLSTCGYGVEIDYQNQAYSLFGYATSTSQPNCSDINVIGSQNRTYFPGESRKVDPSVRLVGSRPDALTVVLFVPPDPRTLISANAAGFVGAGPARIYLQTVDEPPARIYKEIFVSMVGQVDF